MEALETRKTRIKKPKVVIHFQPGEQARVTRENQFEALQRVETVIVIPAYNEERFIGSVVLKARRYADCVIVVDDGSTDGTAEIAAQAGAEVARHAKNLGKGAALNSGFKKACELAPQVVVMLDGDGQHHPEEVGTVIAPILAGEADIVIGTSTSRSLYCFAINCISDSAENPAETKSIFSTAASEKARKPL